LYRTPENQPYDIAVLRMDPQDVDPSLKSVRLSHTAILKGKYLALLNPFCFINRHRKGCIGYQ